MNRQDLASKEPPVSHDPFSGRSSVAVGKMILRNLAHQCGEFRTNLLIFNMFWLINASRRLRNQRLNSNGRLVDNGPSLARIRMAGHRYIERRVQPWA